LLLAESQSLLISFSNIICCVHLEEVKPALSFFILEVMRTYLYYSLITTIASSVASAVHILSHLLLLFLEVLFLADLALAHPAARSLLHTLCATIISL